MLAGQLRLYSGLVLFTFVLTHFINHAFGLHSLEALDSARRYLMTPWRETTGTGLLILAGVTHTTLGLRAIYMRRSLKLKKWEMTQLVLGLCIPFLVAEHILGTRVAELTMDVDPSYAMVMLAFWVGSPVRGALQAVAILVVWIHGCIGLHYWLRTKNGYDKWRRPLGLVAVIIPTLALAGYMAAGIETRNLAEAQDYIFTVLKFSNVNQVVIETTANRLIITLGVIAFLVALPFTVRGIRHFATRLRTRARITYPDGRSFRVPPGATVLEVLRDNGIDHAAVCGGRGRCTTCRLRVVTGADHLPEPDGVEAKALERIHAVEGMRLACQIRPDHDIAIAPLLPPNATAADGRRPGGLEGQEKQVVCMFIDLRGSTKLGEAKLPYDVLFILNQFFAEMTQALDESNGHYAQFNGDGLMALYGIDEEMLEEAARNAARGAALMLQRLGHLNEHLASELHEPLEMGIGVHCGEAIVGAMGPPRNQLTTAIGDSINTTARLEGLTKDYNVPIIFSRAAAEAAGITLPEEKLHEANVRGRGRTIRFYALEDASLLHPSANLS